MSSVRTAHECAAPAETVLNVPDGASARPVLFQPQQVIVSSVRTAHECAPPAEAETVLNVPDGASICPKLLLSVK